MDIPALAKARAEALAKLEALSGDKPSSDKEERAAILRALIDARKAYVRAEEEYQRAVCTMTPEEIAAVLGAAKTERAA